MSLVGRSECGVFSIIRDLLQWNVVGIPDFHRVSEWDFDPDVAQKRREQFYEVSELNCESSQKITHSMWFQVHGFRAAKYLERIGEGIDGRHRQRQYENAVRDNGRLQGLNLLEP